MKKRILTGMIAFMMLLTMISQPALAESLLKTTSKTMVGVLSNGDLLDETRKISNYSINGGKGIKNSNIANVISNAEMDNIVDKLTNLDKIDSKSKYITVNVKGYGITLNNISEAVQYIFNCSPELYYFTNQYQYQYINKEVVSIIFELDDSIKEIKRKNNIINKEVKEFDKLVKPEMTVEDLVLLVHDYLAANVAYDIDGLESGVPSESLFDIYGVFGEKSAVCQGYALAAEYLLNKYDINCGMATSNNVNHAWNIVEIGGKWYHMDATWDDPIYDNMGRVLHQYLLISDNELFSKSQGSEKKDYVTSDRGQKFDGAHYDSYKNKFWRKSKTKIHYYNNNWYYMDSEEFKLYQYNRDTDTSKTVVTNEKMPQEVIWFDTSNPGMYWAENLSRMIGDEQYLYFSTPKNIFCINLADSNYKPYIVFNVGQTKKQIFGLGMWQNQLLYVLKDSPNSNVSESDNNMIFKTDISANCKTNIYKVKSDYNEFTFYYNPVNLIYDDGSKMPIKYQVFYKKNDEKNYKKINTSKIAVTINKLSRNCKYSVKVRPYYSSLNGKIVYGEMSDVREIVTNPLNIFIPRGQINKISYTSLATKLQIKTYVPYIEGGKTTCQLAYKKVGAKNFKYKTFSGSSYNLTGLGKKASYQIKLRYIYVDNKSGNKISSNYSPIKVVQTKE